MSRIILLVFFCCSYLAALGQLDLNELKEKDFVKVQLKEGTELYGQVISIDENFLSLESITLGTIKLELTKIESILVTSLPTIQEEHQEEVFANPMPNKHFLTETAFGVEKGAIQYQNIMLGGHIFTYGISEDFTIGGGFEMFNIFNGEFPFLVVSPKYLITNDSENFQFAVGGNLLLANDGPSNVFAGSLYGLTTYGSRNHNMTLGIGFGFYDGESADSPVVQLGGMTRLTKNVMLVVDQLLISNSYESAFVGSVAIRFLWKKFNIDLGVGTDYYGAIPLISGGYIFNVD